MIRFELDGCSVALGDIAATGGSRRDAERAAIAGMLAEVAGLPVTILHRPDGSPYTDTLPVHISISHSRVWGALLWSSTPGFGIDIEETDRIGQLGRVAPRFLNPDELKYYSAQPAGLLRAWTLKEATFKAAGLPDVADLREIKLPCGDHGEITLRDRRLEIVFSGPTDGGPYMSVVRQAR